MTHVFDTTTTDDLADEQIEAMLRAIDWPEYLASDIRNFKSTYIAEIALARLMRDHPELFKGPVDPDVLTVREAMAKRFDEGSYFGHANSLRNGFCDNGPEFLAALDLLRAAKPTEPKWIDWHGGECPVPAGSDCEVRLRNGRELRTTAPQELRWQDEDLPGDIVAYRVWP